MGDKRGPSYYEDPKAERPADLSRRLRRAKRAGNVHTIKGRGVSGSLRVGALSWSQFHDGRQRWIPDEELTRSLRLVSERLEAIGASGIDADVVVCSGAAIWSPRKASYDSVSREIVKASGGVSVLSEWKEERGDPAEWNLADGDGLYTIRNCQYVTASDKAKRDGHLVLEEIGTGVGRIRVGKTAELVLILCNEARILQHSSGDGLFSQLRNRSEPLPGVFSGPWFMLHPSHRPYRNTREGGVGLVAKWFNASSGQNEEPVFEIATSRKVPYKDGTHAPRAVVHAGPFNPNRPNERELATMAFEGGRSVKHATPGGTPITVPGLVEVQYAEFEFKLP